MAFVADRLSAAAARAAEADDKVEFIQLVQQITEASLKVI
jgi:hypothetical protein